MRARTIGLLLFALVPFVCSAEPPNKNPSKPELKLEVSDTGASLFGSPPSSPYFWQVVIAASSGGVGIATLGTTVPFDGNNPITLPAGWSLHIVYDDVSDVRYLPCEVVPHGFTNLGFGAYQVHFTVICRSNMTGVSSLVNAPGVYQALISYSGDYAGTTLKRLQPYL